MAAVPPTGGRGGVNVAGMDLPVLIHPHAEGLPLPHYQTIGSSAFDLLAAMDQAIRLKPD